MIMNHKSSSHSQPRNEFDDVRHLFVVLCLYFFQGQEKKILNTLGLDANYTYQQDEIEESDISKQLKSSFEKDDDKDETQIIIQCIKKIYKYRKAIYSYKKGGDKKDKGRDKENTLQEIQNQVNNYIFSRDNIWNETEKSSIFARNPFCTNDIDNIRILVVICLYLLRGYCTFWIEKSLIGGKDSEDPHNLNWAKASLNDFIQAYYLCWRLYNKNYQLVNNNTNYVNAVKEVFKFDDLWQELNSNEIDSVFKYCLKNLSEKEKLGFIIWWLFLFIEIFSGNVYRKIYNDDAAFDFYCEAMRKFDDEDDITQLIDRTLCNTPSQNTQCNIHLNIRLKIENLFCKTIIKTRFEKAKIFFNKGHFLESLKWHLRSLMDILLLSFIKHQHHSDTIKNIPPQYHNLQEIIEYLKHEKELLIFDKNLLKNLMWEHLAKDLSQLKGLIDEEYWHLASDILPRIGFVLYTLRIHKISEVGSEELLKSAENYIDCFFKPEAIFGNNKYKNSYGSYCRAFAQPLGDFKYDDFADKPERIFSAIAKQKIHNTLAEEHYNSPNPSSILALQLGIISMANIDNVVTIPKMLNSFLMRRGYKVRSRKIREEGPMNKLVILRRWQSFNPIIPRPHETRFRGSHVPGGGYFLLWQGKGIVIDPGFDFIQNFYDEGFSVEDIDAVILTHAHIDHDDELSCILTLLYEWNKFWEKQVIDWKKEESVKLQKKIDLFLNEGSYRKFHSWLYSPTEVVKKIYQLPLNVWDIEDKIAEIREISHRRGKNIEIDLTESYGMALEIIPAIHSEVIAKNSAIGFKLKLNRNNEPVPFMLGITGDTHAYKDIENNYSDCDILIAHLGDIKFREIRSLGDVPFGRSDIENIFQNDNVNEEIKVNKLKNFVAMMDLVDMDKIKGNTYGDIVNAIVDAMNGDHNYKYPNHLGVSGIYNLHKALNNHAGKNNKNKTRLMIIGELPEELSSFRHVLARLLNQQNFNLPDGSDTSYKTQFPNWRVRCLTGDIGLHIGIDIKGSNTLIRCYRCNQNNEMVKEKRHYYPPEKIQETIVKKIGSGMIYLCTECEHAIFPLQEPRYFLSNPYPRYV